MVSTNNRARGGMRLLRIFIFVLIFLCIAGAFLLAWAYIVSIGTVDQKRQFLSVSLLFPDFFVSSANVWLRFVDMRANVVGLPLPIVIFSALIALGAIFMAWDSRLERDAKVRRGEQIRICTRKAIGDK